MNYTLYTNSEVTIHAGPAMHLLTYKSPGVPSVSVAAADDHFTFHRILVLLDCSDVQFTCPRSTRPPKWTACSSPPPILFFLKKSGIHFSILFLSSPNPTEEVIPQAFPSVLSTSPDDGGGPED